MYWQHKQNENEFRAQMINKEMHHNKKGRENTNNQKKKGGKTIAKRNKRAMKNREMRKMNMKSLRALLHRMDDDPEGKDEKPK